MSKEQFGSALSDRIFLRWIESLPSLLNPSTGRALDRGLKMLDDGRAEEALQVLEPALQRSPVNAHLQLYVALAQVEAGNVDEGLPALRALCEREDRNVFLRLFLARALYDAGALAEAQQECATVLRQQPEHPAAMALSWLCRAHGEPAQALGKLCLAELPDDSEMQARALLVAESVLEESPQPCPGWQLPKLPWELASEHAIAGDPRKLLKRAYDLEKDDQYERAIPFAEASLRARETDEAVSVVAMLYFEAGRYAEAATALADRFTDDPERNTLYGVSLFELGELNKAVEALERGDRSSARGQHTLGRARLALGQNREARHAFLRSARLDPALVHRRIARAYLSCRVDLLMEITPDVETTDAGTFAEASSAAVPHELREDSPGALLFEGVEAAQGNGAMGRLDGREPEVPESDC